MKARKEPTELERDLAASLKAMLDCYWAEGDGHKAPEFILKAQRLVRQVRPIKGG